MKKMNLDWRAKETDGASSCGSTGCGTGRRTIAKGEGGYTLVALLALMTVMALFAMAAAPTIHQQAQRERETEAIFRGEEVAEAIKQYVRYSAGNQLPTSMDQLLEGVTLPGRTAKIQILRQEAGHDPLTKSGEWRLIRPRSQELIAFQRSVMIYAGNRLPQPSDPIMQRIQQQSVPQLVNVLNTGSSDATPLLDSPDDAGATGPFIGVASHSKSKAVLTYYGIDRDDQWIFTPLFR
jgi:type II secretory pathway pseudopilin PulG